MIKLLVKTPSGEQKVIEVKRTGRYFNKARVLWDEREDGPLLVTTVGGWKRVGDDLVFDQATQDAHDAAIAPKPKRITLNELTPVEGRKLIDFLQTNSIVTAARAAKLKGN